MIKGRFLRRPVLDALRETVPQNLKHYRQGTFDHLCTDPSVFFEGTFEIDESVLESIRSPQSDNLLDVENSEASYGAMKSLTPYEARDERFWVYLTHTFLLDYARKRWPIPTEDVEAVEHIRT